MYQPTAPIYQSLNECGNSNAKTRVGESSRASTSPSPTKYECPLCFNYLLPPIYQCFNGHTLCSSCESKVKRCPSCREDLPTKKIRSLVLEELVVGFKFNCMNQHLGCPVTNLKYGQIGEHASNCLFVEVPYCELLSLNCKEKFTAGHVVEHLKTAHLVTGVDFGNENSSDYVVQVFQCLPEIKMKRSKNLCFAPHFLKWEDKLFFLKTRFDSQEKCCFWMVCMAGTGDAANAANNLVASIKLMPRTASVSSLEWCGPIGNLRTQLDYNLFTFSIPLKTLELYGTAIDSDNSNADGSLKWLVKVRMMKRDKPPIPPPCSSSLRLGLQLQEKEKERQMNRKDDSTTKQVGQKSSPPPVPLRPSNSKSTSSLNHNSTFVLVTEVMDSPKLGFVDKIGRDMRGLENYISNMKI